MGFEHITKMENILNDQEQLLVDLKQQMAPIFDKQKEYQELVDYYTSQQYMNDIDDYKDVKIPKDLNCGVLSEDAIYNLITARQACAIELLELATLLLKQS